MKFTSKEIQFFQENNKSNQKLKKQYFHEDYSAFNRIELSSISFGWVFYGVLNYLFIKAFLTMLSMLFLYLSLKMKFMGEKVKNSGESKESSKEAKKLIHLFGSLVYKSMGVSVNELDLSKTEDVLAVYRKYLGASYTPPSLFTTIIANHISWGDILYLGSKNAPSFVAKISAAKYPLISLIGDLTGAILFDRTRIDQRIETSKRIEQRQYDIMNGSFHIPLCIYPEGTATNGRCIIKFKKGAFYSLTPIKLFVLMVDNSHGSIPLATGGMNILTHIILSLTFWRVKVTSMELPVFAPNDFLYENFGHLGKDKQEIFSEATRRVMSEVSGLPLSNSTFEDKLKYMSEIKRKIITNT